MHGNAVRDLRQVAEILRNIDIWNDGVQAELRSTWSRLETLAELIENQDFEAFEPTVAKGAPQRGAAPAAPGSNVIPLARRAASR